MVMAGVIVACIAVVIAVLLIRSNKKHTELLRKHNHLMGAAKRGNYYGWYDPEFAKRFGSSRYEAADGRSVKVTAVSDNPYMFSHRKWPAGTVFLGKLRRFVEQGDYGTDDLEECFGDDFDLSDVAVLLFIYSDIFDSMYYEMHPEEDGYDDAPPAAEGYVDESQIDEVDNSLGFPSEVEAELPSIETTENVMEDIPPSEISPVVATERAVVEDAPSDSVSSTETTYSDSDSD